ncbi:MAG TPA: SDR family oxidoreductase [Candidatus Saccharibacteria bacterium]|nr:SDR family oxidoreductase [Candidatus Saccharibacteria bacterium]
MRIFVLGDDGMLGHVVKQYFKEQGYEVKGTSRSNNSDFQFDVMKNINDFEKFIADFKPEVVINCIGILNKVAEDNKPLAVMANSYLPHYIDDICRNNKIKFIHVSTDCVFDGKKGEYDEDSFKDATSFYGQSKALGEVDNDYNLTLRTSIVGPDKNENGIGLFQWFMNQEKETNGFDKVIWTGVTTIEFAKCMERAIQNNLTGLRHVVNNQQIDKCSLLNLFKKHFKKDIVIKLKSDYVSNKSLVRTTDFDFEIPSYDQMVKEMSEWVSRHEEFYSESQRVSK